MRILTRAIPLLTMLLLLADIAVAQEITAKQLLQSYNPRARGGVNVETPKLADMEKCTREIAKEGKGSSWVVFGPAGQVLRRFTDTDGDGKVDQFRYYNLGVEVYRDIDSDGDEKIDQFRWLNSGGTRWGLDTDGNGAIDEWKRLSAQEAAEVAVTAIIAGDDDMLQTVLINAADLGTLDLTPGFKEAALLSVSDWKTKVKASVAGAKELASGSKWMRFDAQAPGLIPAGKVSGKDLVVYENAMAMVEVAGKPSLVHVGELVEVGDIWKLLNIPAPAGGKQIPSRSVLMQPELQDSDPVAPGGANTPEMQALLAKLRKLDENAPGFGNGGAAIAKYNRTRAELLAKLADISPTVAQKDEWTRQLSDGVVAAQTQGGWPQGLKLLQDLEKDIARDPARSKTSILPYVAYRSILAEYSTRSRAAGVAARQDAQDWFLEELDKFAKKHPRSPEAAEALIELAKNLEFMGKLDEAESAYRRVKRDHPSSPGGKLAGGALIRLGLEGKRLSLSGKDFQKRDLNISQYKGKVTLVTFWTTWCVPCKEELPKLKALHAKYQRQGFEVLGVNLDDANSGPAIDAYLKQNKPRWNNIHDPGGMQGTMSQNFGIISLPTMFLVDRKGVVIARSVSLDELTKAMPQVLAGKPLRDNGKAAPPADRRAKRK